MMPLHLSCYRLNAPQPPHVFYILAKGDNAGKPSLEPWVNSFMAVCSTNEMKEFYFWLVYGLHKSRRFKVCHRGTAIQFINKEDIQRLVREIAPPLYEHWQQFMQIVNKLNKLEQTKITLQQLLTATESFQYTLINSYFQSLSAKE